MTTDETYVQESTAKQTRITMYENNVKITFEGAFT